MRSFKAILSLLIIIWPIPSLSGVDFNSRYMECDDLIDRGIANYSKLANLLKSNERKYLDGDLPPTISLQRFAALNDSDRFLAGWALKEWQVSRREVGIFEAIDMNGEIVERILAEGSTLDLNGNAGLPAGPPLKKLFEAIENRGLAMNLNKMRINHVHLIKGYGHRRFSTPDIQISFLIKALMELSRFNKIDLEVVLLEPSADVSNAFDKFSFVIPSSMKWDKGDYPLSKNLRKRIRRIQSGLNPIDEFF